MVTRHGAQRRGEAGRKTRTLSVLLAHFSLELSYFGVLIERKQASMSSLMDGDEIPYPLTQNPPHQIGFGIQNILEFRKVVMYT